jgi:hypothetical protein
MQLTPAFLILVLDKLTVFHLIKLLCETGTVNYKHSGCVIINYYRFGHCPVSSVLKIRCFIRN